MVIMNMNYYASNRTVIVLFIFFGQKKFLQILLNCHEVIELIYKELAFYESSTHEHTWTQTRRSG